MTNYQILLNKNYRWIVRYERHLYVISLSEKLWLKYIPDMLEINDWEQFFWKKKHSLSSYKIQIVQVFTSVGVESGYRLQFDKPQQRPNIFSILFNHGFQNECFDITLWPWVSIFHIDSFDRSSFKWLINQSEIKYRTFLKVQTNHHFSKD